VFFSVRYRLRRPDLVGGAAPFYFFRERARERRIQVAARLSVEVYAGVRVQVPTIARGPLAYSLRRLIQRVLAARNSLMAMSQGPTFMTYP
jgi:hypothetical protein